MLRAANTGGTTVQASEFQRIAERSGLTVEIVRIRRPANPHAAMVDARLGETEVLVRRAGDPTPIIIAFLREKP